MKHAVIFAHPNRRSFTASVADAYVAAVEAMGQSAVCRDLYGMNFDPRLSSDELPFGGTFKPRADVVAERDILKDVDVFVLVYPLWLNAPPAMLKGYLDRVFGYGFAYGNAAEPLLKGRKLISFTSSGAPLHWVRQTGDFDALQTLFDRHFASVCGMEFVEHVHAGSIVPGIREDAVLSRLKGVRDFVANHFGGPK
jgi:NAD(P)H dehydrogenase (quinone)